MKSNIEFLYEELRKATDGGSESMTHDDALKQIAYWRDECNQVQAQAVEPVCSQCKGLGYYDEGHENDDGSMSGGNYVDCACNKKDFTQCTTVTNDCLGGCKSLSEHQNYTHPAPPATGECAKVGDSKFESWYSELNQSRKGSKQIAREAYEAGLNEAQQVAVPMTNGEIYTAYITATNQTLRPQDEKLALAFARAIEAHHGIRAKLAQEAKLDHKPDWSAA